MNYVLKIVMLMIMILFFYACSGAIYHKGDTRMNKIANSPQYKEGKFKNYRGWDQPSFGEYLSTGWDFLFSGDEFIVGGPQADRHILCKYSI